MLIYESHFRIPALPKDSVENDHELPFMAILPLSLIQEGQTATSGSMGTKYWFTA